VAATRLVTMMIMMMIMMIVKIKNNNNTKGLVRVFRRLRIAVAKKRLLYHVRPSNDLSVWTSTAHTG
jgi:hypothetical protein